MGTWPRGAFRGRVDPPHHPAGEQGLRIPDLWPWCRIRWDLFPRLTSSQDSVPQLPPGGLVSMLLGAPKLGDRR